MAVAHVQFASQVNTTTSTSVTVTLGSTPTVGNVLVFIASVDYFADPIDFEPPTGFTKLDPTYNFAVGNMDSPGTFYGGFAAWYRVVESGDGTSYTFNANNRYLAGAIVEVSGAGTPVVRSAPFSDTNGVYFAGQNATVESTSYAFMVAYARIAASMSVTTPTGFTELLDSVDSNHSLWCGYDIGATTINDLAVSSGGSYLCGMTIEIPESGTEVTPWDGENFVTVAPSGGEYTSLHTAFLDYDLRNGVYQVRWNSATNYTSAGHQIYPGNFDYRSFVTVNRYTHFTVAPAYHHSGVTGTGAAWDSSSHCFQMVQSPFTRISHWELIPATNQKAVYNNSDNLRLDNLIINCTETTTTNHKAIDITTTLYGGPTMVSNCVIYGGNADFYGIFGTGGTISLYVDHCSIYGQLGFGDNADYTVNLYNNWIYSSASGKEAVDAPTQPTFFGVVGSNNVYGPSGSVDGTLSKTDQSTSWIESSALTTTTTTADAVIVTNLTSGSENFTPVAATGSGSNVILGAGVNRQPTRPDSRVNLSLDIAGNPRPTTNIDLGAFQISEGGAATGTPIKVWTGSAWVNVNNLSYYDGGWS